MNYPWWDIYGIQGKNREYSFSGFSRRERVQMNEPGLGERVEYIAELMEAIIEDTTVPRNIRKACEDARIKISGAEAQLSVNVSNAIYLMEDISNDINMPAHTRTEIWTIISELEAIREKCKG